MGESFMRLASIALAPALVAAACGRTPLSEWYGAEGAGGAGGAPSTTGSAGSAGTTGSAGSSGTGAGGPVEPCDGLVTTGDPISTAASGSQLEPALGVAKEGDAILAYRRETGPLIAFARFDAWSPMWPETLVQKGIPDFNFLFSFIIGPGPHGPSLVGNQGPVPESLFFGDTFIQGLSGNWFESGPRRELFIARSPDRSLVALSNDIADSRLTLYELGGVPWQNSAAWGCGSTPVVAAASAVPGGQIVAMSSGAPFGECEPTSKLGPSTRLQIGFFGPGLKATLGSELELSEPVANLALAPRAVTAEGAGGAWLVYQSDGSTSLLPPPIMAARLDALGALIGDPFPVTSSGATEGPIAAAALGQRLLVVWYEAIDDGPPSLVAQLIEPDGTPGASAWLTSETWIQRARLALLGSPDGTQFVVAWESAPDGPLKDHRVRIARFGCTTNP
jgi:hypothetical protein